MRCCRIEQHGDGAEQYREADAAVGDREDRRRASPSPAVREAAAGTVRAPDARTIGPPRGARRSRYSTKLRPISNTIKEPRTTRPKTRPAPRWPLRGSPTSPASARTVQPARVRRHREGREVVEPLCRRAAPRPRSAAPSRRCRMAPRAPGPSRPIARTIATNEALRMPLLVSTLNRFPRAPAPAAAPRGRRLPFFGVDIRTQRQRCTGEQQELRRPEKTSREL